MTRADLLTRCRELNILAFDTDSDRDLAEFIAMEEREIRRRENPEEYGDERSAADVYAGAE